METVDEALELLTGIPVGAPSADGTLPEGSLNQRVTLRVAHLAELWRKHARKRAKQAKRGSPGARGEHDD